MVPKCWPVAGLGSPLASLGCPGQRGDYFTVRQGEQQEVLLAVDYLQLLLTLLS